MNNVPADNLRLMDNESGQLGFNKIAHSPYSPDISSGGYWPFGFLKRQLKRRQSASGQEILEDILAVLKEIAEPKLLALDEK